MKRLVLILSLLLSLSAHASYFEVQVTMAEPQPVQVIGHHTMTTGRFTTTVNPLDDCGCACAPGQSATTGRTGPFRAKKVEEDDYEDDPFMSNVMPVGATPYVLFGLLILAYFGIKIKSRRKKAS